MIEKIIVKIENKNPYVIETEKEPEIVLEIEKNIGSVDVFISSYFMK